MKFKLLLYALAFIFGSFLFTLPVVHAQNILTVVAPSAGQVWNVGTIQTIIWTPNNNTYSSTGSSNPTVNLNLYPASACTSGTQPLSCTTSSAMTPYIIALNVPNTGSYQWSIPSTLPSAYQGSDVITVGLSDSSAQGSAQFIIAGTGSGATSSSQMSLPAVGAQWVIGTTQSVQWQVGSSTASSVTVELLPNGSTSPAPYIIATNVPNNGSYLWNIGNDMNGNPIPAGQYLIALVNPATNSVFYTSPGLFSLNSSSQSSTSSPLTISQLSPNSGPVGMAVTVSGSGFSSSTNTILFGSGTYIANIGSSNGNSLQFTVPSQTQPCPPGSTQACTFTTALITPGTYPVSVSNASSTSNALSFTVTPGQATSTQPSGMFPDGSLVLVTGNPTVYLARAGMLVPFSSATIFLGWGYQWSQIEVISPAQFQASGQPVSSVPVQSP
jgi:hypothetical protein